jgi:hypothetical protein
VIRILHFVCLGIGIALVAATWLVYENEEKQIQSKLENLWIRLSDYGSQLITQHSAASSRIFAVLTALVDHVFGPKILSLRFLAASLSISSVGIFLMFMIFGLRSTYDDMLPVVFDASVGALLVIICLWLGVFRKQRYMFVCIATLVILIVGVVIAEYLYTPKTTRRDNLDFDNLTFFLLPTLCSLLASTFADAVTLLAIRAMRKWAAAAKGFRAVVVTLGIAVVGPLIMAVSAMLVISPAFLFHDNLTGGGFMLVGIVDTLSMNAANVLLFFVLGMIAVVLAIHSALWPFILRPLYALQKEGWARSSKDIRKAGFALIVFGLTLHPGVVHFFSKIGGILGL